MKKLFVILVILCILIAGCGSENKSENAASEMEIHTEATETTSVAEEAETTRAPEETETTSALQESVAEPSSEELLEEYLENLAFSYTPVREYGEETGYIQLEEDLVVRILYPEGEMKELNTEIVKWVDSVVAEYQADSKGCGAQGDAAELTAEYDSYMVEEDIISVKITGLYDKPYLAHPMDLIKTFHASVKTGKRLSLDDILSDTGRETLEKMVIEQAKLDEFSVDEHVLDNWILTKQGLEIILQRGVYLPMSDGTVTLQYSYEQLDGILALSEQEQESVSQSETETSMAAQNGELPSGDKDNSEKPMIALTFDDGPSKHTERLLDIFAEHGGKGTFFVVGNLLDKRPGALQRMAEEGHEIAGHSWNHRQLTKLSSGEVTDQIMNTRAKIYEITGVDSTMLRPPYGSYNKETKSICGDLGVIIVNWSLDTLDWKYKDAKRIHSTIMKNVKDGDIILCHDLHGTTVDAMKLVIPDLIKQGYQLVTVSELLEHSKKEVVPGGVYNNR